MTPEDSFIPDPDGKNVDFQANLSVINSVVKANKDNKERCEREKSGHGCGCRSCRQRLVEDIADNADRADWLTDRGRWDKTITVKPPDNEKNPPPPTASGGRGKRRR